MKSLRTTAFLVLTLALCAGTVSAGEDRLAIGQPAPMADVQMKNIDGSMLSIADAAGTYGTLVMFSCNSCGSVLAYEDRIAMYLNKFQEAGMGVIVINPNDPAVNAVDGTKDPLSRISIRYETKATTGLGRF